MSLNVKHLNADTTFLLTFTPSSASSHARAQAAGAFTVLIDPWLVGTSSVWNPRFQLSRHTRPSCTDSLAAMPLPDLIVISQGKPDHCHKETLCTLPADSPVTILAVPDAIKRIRSWRYFKSANIIRLDPYNPKKPATVHRISILPRMENGSSGELSVSFMEQAGDMTGLHTAIALTYRSPRSIAESRPAPPLTPPISPTRSQHSLAFIDSSQEPITPVDSMFGGPSPTSPAKLNYAPTSAPATATGLASNETPISILYTPHGVPYQTIAPYVKHVLQPIGALPLTTLIHAVGTEDNPWFMGGRVVSGLPGGIELVRKVGARYWISAHDEDKDNQGFATMLIKSKAYTLPEAQAIMDKELGRLYSCGHEQAQTKLLDLDVGQEFET